MTEEPAIQPAAVPTPEQITSVVDDAKIAIAALNELATLVAMVRAHNVAGVLGELRAALAALAAAHQAP